MYGGDDNDLLYGDDIESRVSSSVHGNDLLVGEQGKDTLYGGGKDDTLFGGSEDDILWGDGTNSNVKIAAHGKDLLDGGDGADQMVGGGSDDHLFGGAGNDTMLGDDEVSNVDGSAHGADLLDGGDGNDVMYGDGGNDTLMGGSGNDFIAGEHQTSTSPASQSSTLLGDDSLMGGSGNDTLLGGEGNDTLDGGADSDTLIGGAGSDVYQFGYGSGTDVVFLASADGVADVIQLDTGLNQSSIVFSRTTADLTLRIAGSTDQLTLKEFFTRGVDVIRFGDGTTLVGNSLASKTFASTAGADTLTGYTQDELIFADVGNDLVQGNSGRDTLDGGIGNDSLLGGAGADTYLFGIGSGRDTINNYDTDLVGVEADSILLGSGVAVSDVTLARTGDDLIIRIKGTDDSLCVQSYFSVNGTSTYVVESIKFADTTVWDVAAVKSKVLVPTTDNDVLNGYVTNDTLSGAGGNDTLYGSDGADSLTGDGGNDYLYGEIGDDTLVGGVGNDTVDGGLGNNTYVFGNGDGLETIKYVYDTTIGRLSTLQFKTGVAASQVSVKRVADRLELSINGTSDKVRIEKFFITDNPANPYNPVQQVKFSDGGVIWDLATIKAKALAGDETGQYIIGFNGADSISAAGGNDSVYGQASNDTINAGAGNDALFGGFDNDSLNGDDGDDSLSGEVGDDTLTGGLGSDTLNGGAGNNTYVFGRGDGQDVILRVFDSGLNTLQFKAGVEASQVSAHREDTALVLTINGTSDSIWIEGFFTAGNPVQQVKFSDGGMTWDLATINATVLVGNDSGQYIQGLDGSDVINAAGGDDTVYGQAGNDTINSGTGNDSLYGGEGSDSLTGNDGDDYLQGETGDDILMGGEGNDTLNGGVGNNTYIFGRGDGRDYIQAVSDATVGKFNTFQFKAGVTASQVSAKKWLDVLELSINGTSDKVLIGGFYTSGNAGNPSNPVQQIKFTDGGEVWDLATIKAKVLLNMDSELGFDEADLISKGGGSDSIRGLAGNDTINAGSGNDWLYGGDGADSLNADNGDDYLYGEAGDDTLIGGLGNDRLNGGIGNNTYVFGWGDGQDYIEPVSDPTVGKLSTLQFKVGVSPSQVTVKQWGGGKYVSFSLNGGSDYIGVGNAFYGLESPIQRVIFTDGGVVWDLATISANALLGGQTGRYIVGSDKSESIDASGGNDGNDSLYGGLGDDTLTGGLGNDRLNGGTGNNTYMFGMGDGQDTIQEVYDPSAGKLNTLLFRAGVATSQVTVSRWNTGLELSINGTSEKVVIESFFSDNPANPCNPVQQVQFTDGGVTWDLAAIKAKVVAVGDATDQCLFGFDGPETINAAEGNDTVHGLAGNDTLNGGEGNDSVYGWDGADSLTGDGGDDYLSGDVGDDTLVGGLGNDTLDGGAGNNVYVFGKGDGRDAIQSVDPGRLGTLQIKAGVVASQVLVKRIDANLDLTIGSTSDAIRIAGFFSSDSPVHQVKFTDGGVTWDFAAIQAKVLLADEAEQYLMGSEVADSISAGGGNDTVYGQAGSDTLNGGAGKDALYGGDGVDSLTGDDGCDYLEGEAGGDTLVGGLGCDTLNGGIGNNTYVFGVGDGRDTIRSVYDTTEGKLNILQFKAGVAASQVSVTRVNSNLELTINGTSEKVLIENFFNLDSPANSYNPVQQVKFADGVTWDLAAIKVKVLTGDEAEQYIIGFDGSDLINAAGGDDSVYGQAGNDTINAGMGGDLLCGGDGSDSLNGEAGDDSLSGEAGDDTLIGGVGRDTLNGGAGNNTYVFGAGDGWDVIQGVYNTTPGKFSTLQFKAGVAESQVSVKRSGEWLELSINGTSDAVRIETFCVSDDPVNFYNPVQQVKFTDGGVTWDLVTIKAKALIGDETSQYLVGFDGADYISAAEGHDAVYGQMGDDYLNGGHGNDQLWGGAGADSLMGDGGDDYLVGEAGNDTLMGGVGCDTLAGGGGNNTYVFGLGDGQDTISEDGDATGGKLNTIQFKTGVAASLVSVKRIGGNLELAINGMLDKMVVTHFFDVSNPSNPYNPVQQIQFVDDNIIWNLEAITALANATERMGMGAIEGTASADALYAEFGEDTLYGQAGADFLFGGGGDDFLLGGADADWLYGESGKDTLDGGAANDTLVGGNGDDIYYVDGASDLVIEQADGGEYDCVYASTSYLAPSNVECVELTGAGDFSLMANLDNPVSLFGNDGKNKIVGSAEADVLSGGGGLDTLEGGGGADQYWLFDHGDVIAERPGEGYDSIYTYVDGVVMADNVESLYMNGALVITATGSSMRNSIFGNGKNNVLYGMGGNDVLSAKTGNDTLIGGLGDDRLDGGFGSDTYRFARGDGADTLTDLNYMADNADVLEFLAGIANDQLWLQHIGNDLVVGVIGTADQVTVSNWYQRDDAYKIEKIQAGGKTLNSGMVENLVNAMAVFAPPASGQTTLPASYQSALNGVIAANWQ